MAKGLKPRLNLATARQIIKGTTTPAKVRANGRIAPEDLILLKMAEHGLKIATRKKPPTPLELARLHPKLHDLVMGLRTKGLESKYRAKGLDRVFMEAREQQANVAGWRAEYGKRMRIPRTNQRVAYWLPSGPVTVEEYEGTYKKRRPLHPPKRK
ncbi:MAG: hypothetical protein WC792_06170 [Candidatus Micrarchaeia archaeon]|jgi:hypothetical protein